MTAGKEATRHLNSRRHQSQGNQGREIKVPAESFPKARRDGWEELLCTPLADLVGFIRLDQDGEDLLRARSLLEGSGGRCKGRCGCGHQKSYGEISETRGSDKEICAILEECCWCLERRPGSGDDYDQCAVLLSKLLLLLRAVKARRCFFCCAHAVKMSREKRRSISALLLPLLARPFPRVLEHVLLQVVAEILVSRMKLAALLAADSSSPLLDDVTSILRLLASDFLKHLEGAGGGAGAGAGGVSSWQMRVLESVLRELKNSLIVQKQENDQEEEEEEEQEEGDGDGGEDEVHDDEAKDDDDDDDDDGEEDEEDDEQICCVQGRERQRRFTTLARRFLSQTMGVIAAMASRKLEEEDEEEIPAGGATGGRLELISSFLSVGHRAHKMLLLSLPSLLPSVCFLLRSRCFLDDCGDSAAIFLRRKTIALLLKSAAVLEDEEVRTQLKSLLPSSAARVSSSCPLLDRRVQLNSRCLSLLLLLRVTRMDLAKTQEEPLNGSTRLLSSLQHLEWILQSENNEDRDGKEEQEQGQEQEQSTNRRPQKRQKSSQDTKGSRASSSFLLQKIISVLLDADDCLIDGLLDLLEIHRRGLELLSSQKLQGGNKELLDQISPQQILDSLTSLWSGDSSFIIELLLSPDTNALEFLVVLLRQLDLQHTSSPSSSSSSSSGDRKLLLQDLRTRLQGAWSKGTFPFNVQPLLRRLDRVLL